MGLLHIDPGGALRVGPRSVGAEPGPVCYGKGRELTVTDANLFLGRIYADHFLGGRMGLNTDMVDSCMGLVAKKLKMNPVKVAEGIIEIENANMERAIKVVSVEKGFDIGDYTLLSFGGAGGLHACELADSLSMKRILVPKHAGVLSALGMTVADVVKDYSKSVLLKVGKDGYSKLSGLFKPLNSLGMKEVLSEGIGENSIKIENSVDVRYAGQSHELTLPFKKSYIADFHKLHNRVYGYSNLCFEIEVVNIRVRVVGKTKKPSLGMGQTITHENKLAINKKTKCFYRGKWLKADIIVRDKLRTRYQIKGPVLIVEGTSTTFLPPEYICNVDDHDNLIIKKS